MDRHRDAEPISFSWFRADQGGGLDPLPGYPLEDEGRSRVGDVCEVVPLVTNDEEVARQGDGAPDCIVGAASARSQPCLFFPSARSPVVHVGRTRVQPVCSDQGAISVQAQRAPELSFLGIPWYQFLQLLPVAT